MAKFTIKAANEEAIRGETAAINPAGFGPSGMIAGVAGIATDPSGLGPGVLGRSNGKGPGVIGFANSDGGVLGVHGDPNVLTSMPAASVAGGRAGVFGVSDVGAGVVGFAGANDQPGVYAIGGLLAVAPGKEFVADFRGDVKVLGDILLSGADCAEQFDVPDGEPIEPGSVLIIADGGGLRQSDTEYDTRVAGVVSGAGDYRPGMILDQQPSSGQRLSVALIGKVFCKVDGSHGPIVAGDLLTTSPTPGCAMKASDPHRTFGSVLGKALAPWDGGRGLIPTLVLLG
ncbi:hypothetical protein [Nocardia sp. NPDC058480]|uniref:hypothetical protein n=1 Tax=unclassified Nocardia TaxID=2637762 RepID=UPI0036573789